MIELMFEYAYDYVLVRIEGHNVLFGNTQFGAKLADISGLKLDYVGVCREFPDLELDPQWKQKAITRFKEKIASFDTENDIAIYIIDDLKKHGYKPLWKQVQGFRRQKIGDAG